jgi:hypothetical protein
MERRSETMRNSAANPAQRGLKGKNGRFLVVLALRGVLLRVVLAK